MTINKAQGQTFDKVGVFLPEPVFAHGQLYVALSRVRSKDSLKILVTDTNCQGRLDPLSDATFVRNVVYKEVL